MLSRWNLLRISASSIRYASALSRNKPNSSLADVENKIDNDDRYRGKSLLTKRAAITRILQDEASSTLPSRRYTAIPVPAVGESALDKVDKKALEGITKEERDIGLPVPISKQLSSFQEVFGELIPADVMQKMQEMEVKWPTPVQAALIHQLLVVTDVPSIAADAFADDLLVQTQTGTGKSLGYLIAVISRAITKGQLDGERSTKFWKPRYLILVPSSILAVQLLNWTKFLLDGSGRQMKDIVRVLMNLSDMPDEEDFDGIEMIGQSEVLIATPGRLREALIAGQVDPRCLELLIVDEVDSMVKVLPRQPTDQEISAHDRHPCAVMAGIGELLRSIPKEQKRPRCIYLSATLNKSVRIALFRNEILRPRYKFIMTSEAASILGPGHLGDEAKALVGDLRCPPGISHYHTVLSEESMYDAGFIEDSIDLFRERTEDKGCPPFSGVIFVPKSESKKSLRDALNAQGKYNAIFLSDYVTNPEPASPHGRPLLLLASETDSRGLDLPNLTHVIIWGAADTTADYLHMAGRVGRFGQGRMGHVLNILDDSRGSLSKHAKYTHHLDIRSTPIYCTQKNEDAAA